MATSDEKDSHLHALMGNITSFEVPILQNLSDIFPLLAGAFFAIASNKELPNNLMLIGSTAEGLALLSNDRMDLDIMDVSNHSVVYEHHIDNVANTTWQFQIQFCPKDPGYVRLIKTKQGTEAYFGFGLPDIGPFLEHNSASSYLKNTIGQHVASMIQQENPFPFIDMKSQKLDITKQGPCTTLSQMFKNPSKGTFYDFDFVIGLRCPEWPSVASEWKSRDRRYGWPSKEFIDHHVRNGCYVVPVGCKDCVEKHLDWDWRISFAHVEKALVHTMNSNDIKCFILLRHLKKRLFDIEIPKVITSYIIKTTLFWTIEEISPDLWKTYRPLTAVEVCLDKLITFIRNDFCPHFFIRTCNLFIGRYSPLCKKRVLETCLEAKRNLNNVLQKTPVIEREIRLDNMNNMLMTSKNRVQGTLMYALVHLFLRIVVSGLNSEQDLISYCKTVQKRIDGVMNKTDFFKNKEIIRESVRNVTERWLMSCRKKDSDDNDIDIEDLNSIANTCHLQMVARSYIRCNDLIMKFLDFRKCRKYRKLIYLDIFDPANEVVSKVMFNVFNAFTGDDQAPLISDMIFAQRERDTLPTTLQTELSVSEIGVPTLHKGTLLVDPLVYMCFLRFWCSMRMDQNIEMLKARDDMVWCCSLANISEKAVALNLLAYCHSQLEEYEKAFNVLCRAFREKPLSSTLIHIATLLNSEINRSRY